MVTISIYKEKQAQSLFEKTLDPQEVASVLELCDEKVDIKRASWKMALLIPVRTDKIGHFCQDFFLPTVAHVASKVDSLAWKVIVCAISFVLDIATLAIRAITIIPRYVYNARHPKENHVLYRYLTKQKVKPQDLEQGFVEVKIVRTAVTKQGDYKETVRKWEDKILNFMSLPERISDIKSSRGETVISTPEICHPK